MDILDYFHTLNLINLYRHIGVTLLCWLVMFIAVMIDMWDGVQTARILNERIDSKGLRRTFAKTGEYWRMMLFGLMFDTLGLLFTWYTLPYMTIIITLGVLVIEFRSVWEHNRRKRSHAAELPSVIANIIRCTSEKDSLELIRTIKREAK
jgi:hypothetical protein